MNLEYRKFDKNYLDKSKIKHLYEHAFPSEERPPFNRLIAFKHNDLYGVHLNNEFVGLLDLVIMDDLIYLFFLAVKVKYRNLGIGRNIINDIKVKYPHHRLYLLAEEIDDKYLDNDLRKRRIAFYNRQGLHLTNIRINEYGVIYSLLSTSNDVTGNDFLKTMELILGDYYSIYKDNVELV